MRPTDGGKLRIGDDWNAIRIIALSQSNALKAIAEFVENSIDALARSREVVANPDGTNPSHARKDEGATPR